MGLLSWITRKKATAPQQDARKEFTEAFRQQLIQQVLSGGFKSPGRQRRHKYANMTISEIRYTQRREER